MEAKIRRMEDEMYRLNLLWDKLAAIPHPIQWIVLWKSVGAVDSEFGEGRMFSLEPTSSSKYMRKNEDQTDFLIQYMEDHIDFACNRFVEPNADQDQKRQWAALTMELNNRGFPKSVEKWQRKASIADSIGTSTEVKEAVRKVIRNIITKTVQELYSAVGKKGLNGVTKKSFRDTSVYSCMTDVLKEKLESADDKNILSITNRYLSGACDREGGKAEREAKKYQKYLCYVLKIF